MDIPNDRASFADLNKFVNETFIHLNKTSTAFKGSLWEKIREDPVSKRGIKGLEEKGWTVLFDIIIYDGMCDFKNRKITIYNSLDDFSRDKSTYHELVHAYYGNISFDGNMWKAKDETADLEQRKNRVLVDWYARQIRATPPLLAAIWETFNISPRIYDRASLSATNIIHPNLKPGPPEKDYNFTLMD